MKLPVPNDYIHSLIDGGLSMKEHDSKLLSLLGQIVLAAEKPESDFVAMPTAVENQAGRLG